MARTDPDDSNRSESETMILPEAGDSLDVVTFGQILEMDDEDDRDFSRSIVLEFFTQAESTFNNMDSCLAEKDLKKLSDLGHFLKGSSATLGLTKVRDSCEKIQHLGAKKDETGTMDGLDDKVCLERLKPTIEQAKQEFADVEKVLKKFYDQS